MLKALDKALSVFPTAKVTELKNWTPSDRLELFIHRFEGRPDQFIIDTNGECFTVKRPVTTDLYRAHLEGKRRFGIFTTVGGRAKLGCIDLDSNSPAHAQALFLPCKQLGIRGKLATSRSGNYHLYLFMSSWVEASKLRRLMDLIVQRSGLPFKKGEKGKPGFKPGVDKGRIYPNRAGLWLPFFGLRHALENSGNGLFVDPHSLKPFGSLEAQWRVVAEL